MNMGMTNRELVGKAMPLVSLSREMWDAVNKHLDYLERYNGRNTPLYQAFKTLQEKKKKIEVMGDYFESINYECDEPVKENSVPIMAIA